MRSISVYHLGRFAYVWLPSAQAGGPFVPRRDSTIARDLRVNEMIRIREVRVIDEDGQQLGVMPTSRALALAQEKGLDLVEVAPTAVPPVCRILDYGQYKYELNKRERETKKRQKSHEMKEIRVAVKIDTHDLQTKARRAAEFLDGGDRVKITVRFRGREISHANLGRDLLVRTAETLAEHGTVERQPLLEGRSMHIIMAPLERRPEKKSETGGETAVGSAAATAGGPAGETIADAVAAQARPAAQPQSQSQAAGE
jgi:translation initiation factor IF-3